MTTQAAEVISSDGTDVSQAVACVGAIAITTIATARTAHSTSRQAIGVAIKARIVASRTRSKTSRRGAAPRARRIQNSSRRASTLVKFNVATFAQATTTPAADSKASQITSD